MWPAGVRARPQGELGRERWQEGAPACQLQPQGSAPPERCPPHPSHSDQQRLSAITTAIEQVGKLRPREEERHHHKWCLQRPLLWPWGWEGAGPSGGCSFPAAPPGPVGISQAACPPPPAPVMQLGGAGERRGWLRHSGPGKGGCPRHWVDRADPKAGLGPQRQPGLGEALLTPHWGALGLPLPSSTATALPARPCAPAAT